MTKYVNNRPAQETIRPLGMQSSANCGKRMEKETYYRKAPNIDGMKLERVKGCLPMSIHRNTLVFLSQFMSISYIQSSIPEHRYKYNQTHAYRMYQSTHRFEIDPALHMCRCQCQYQHIPCTQCILAYKRI